MMQMIHYERGDKMEINNNNSSSYSSCFDVIGPIMVGPSSSHTAGAINIGAAAVKVFQGIPDQVYVRYYESFSETHQGHGTDFAIVAGILQLDYDDPNVPKSVEIAEAKGMEIEFIENDEPSPFHHPNTADIILANQEKRTRLAGISIGGGKIEIPYLEVNDFKLNIQGPLPGLLLMTDQSEVQQSVENMMVKDQVRYNHKIVQENQGQTLLYYGIEHYFPEELFAKIKEMTEISYAVLF